MSTQGKTRNTVQIDEMPDFLVHPIKNKIKWYAVKWGENLGNYVDRGQTNEAVVTKRVLTT